MNGWACVSPLYSITYRLMLLTVKSMAQLCHVICFDCLNQMQNHPSFRYHFQKILNVHITIHKLQQYLDRFSRYTGGKRNNGNIDDGMCVLLL
uniref:Uncharacterized protein n=1 Tax=Anguilla anguilla TaxID=7936 RepID=A0A0E9WZV4_ANGAN